MTAWSRWVDTDKNILSSYIYYDYHDKKEDIWWADFLWYENLEQEVLDESKNKIKQPEVASPEAEDKIDVLEVKAEVVQSAGEVEAIQQDKINKTSEYFAETKFATKIDSALRQIGSRETASEFMDKIDKLFVDLMSREFGFLPDDVRENLWASVWSALLSWLYDVSETTTPDPKKSNTPSKAQAIWWLFNSLTWVDVKNIQSAGWWFDLIKQVLSMIWWYDLLKNQLTKVSYMLDMILILKEEDKQKNIQFDWKDSVINDPSRFVSTLQKHDKWALLDIKKSDDKSHIIWLVFGDIWWADMKDMWDKLWDIVDDKTAKHMIQGMNQLHRNGTKLMNNRDANQQKFKWFYDVWKNVLSQIDWLAQSFGMGKEETSWLRSVLNWVFMIFTGKRFDSYEDEEIREKYYLDTTSKKSLEQARSDYLNIDPSIAIVPLGDKIVSSRPKEQQDMISNIDKNKLTSALISHIDSIDEKLVTDILGDKKTWDIEQDIRSLIEQPNFWSKISSDAQIADKIKDGAGLTYMVWLLLMKGDTYLEVVKSGILQIPYVKQSVSMQPETNTQRVSDQDKDNKSDWDKKTTEQENTSTEDISTIKDKKINTLTSQERKLLFEHIFGVGPATKFLTLMDKDYWSGSGNIYLNVLALAKHEWGLRFWSAQINGDRKWQTAMGTFQISAKWWRSWVQEKYKKLINQGIKYLNKKGIWANYNLSEYSAAQQDLLAFIWHTNGHTKIGWPEKNWKKIASTLFDNTKDAAFMSDIQVGISAIGKDVAQQIQKNKVDHYV